MSTIELEIKSVDRSQVGLQSASLPRYALIDLSSDPSPLNRIPASVLEFPVRHVDVSHHSELRLERKDLHALTASCWNSSLTQMIVDLAVVERSCSEWGDAVRSQYASILSKIGVCVRSECELNKAHEIGFPVAKIFLPAGHTQIPDWVLSFLQNEKQQATSLHVRENPIGVGGIQHLMSILLSRNPPSPLQNLDIGDTDLTDVGAQEMSALLCKACPNLVSISLDLNGITDSGAADVAEAIKGAHSLKYISLFGNHITAKGTKLIADAICEPGQSVTFLNLDENEIEDEGAIALATALKSEFCMLSTLVLEDIEIGDTGAGAIASALAKNTRLTTLFLSRNEIGNNGAHSLAEALRNSNTTLRTLDLRLTNIGDDGIHEMIEMLKQNKTLDDLRLDHHALPSPLRKLAISASNDCISGVHQRNYSSLARCVRNIFADIQTVSFHINEDEEEGAE